MTDTNTKNEMTLTQDQRNILLSAGVPQDRLNDGVLLPSEKQLLAWLAQAQAFMVARYPAETITFVGVDNTFPRITGCFLHAVSASAPDARFTVKVTAEEITESLYAIHKQPEMEEILREAFAQADVSVGLEVTLDSLYGEDYDPQAPLKQTLAEGRLISVSGFAYVQFPGLDALQQHLQTTLRAAGLCGGFALCAVKSSIEEVLGRTGSNRPYVTQRVFVSLPADAQEVK